MKQYFNGYLPIVLQVCIHNQSTECPSSKYYRSYFKLIRNNSSELRFYECCHPCLNFFSVRGFVNFSYLKIKRSIKNFWVKTIDEKLIHFIHPQLYIYNMFIQFWNSTRVNVRLSYCFKALLLWMLLSLFLFTS